MNSMTTTHRPIWPPRTDRRSLAASWMHLLLVLLATGSGPSPAWATSYSCGSLESRVVDSEMVVVGRTARIQRTNLRPGYWNATYYFIVDEVLKGRAYRPGDVHRETSWRRGLAYGPHLPVPECGVSVVFLGRGEGRQALSG
jgi:hypothetical protein